MASRKNNPPKPLKATIADPKPKDPEKACVKQIERVLSAIQLQRTLIQDVLAMWSESREGMIQVRGELEQIRTHLARFIDQGIRERSRDERIEEQLAGINERLRERSKVDRVLHHGKLITAGELSRELDAMERVKGEEIATLRGEVDRLRSELEASRATAAALNHGRMPPPKKSWRTTVTENVTAAPID